MTYRIGICDDKKVEAHITTLYIKDYAKRHDCKCSVREFYMAEKMEQYLLKEELDIVFLDIDLDGDEEKGKECLSQNNGITLARKFRKIYPDLVIIFVTGHREFTAHAFDVEAIGYILKPIDQGRLERILKKGMLQVNALKSEQENGAILVTEENLKKKLNISDIIRLERQNRKTRIITLDKDYYVYETIASLEEQLKGKFLRISQSDLVNPSRIIGIEKNQAILRNGTRLNIGRTYIKKVREWYFHL